MSNVVMLETAEYDLKGLLAQLSLGETVTLSNDDGQPLALLVSLQSSTSEKPVPDPDWIKKWDALAAKVDKAWQGEQGAVETLLEMRR